jgi:hypothetical protein
MEGLVVEGLATFEDTQYTDDDRPTIAIRAVAKQTFINFCPFCGRDFRMYYKK